MNAQSNGVAEPKRARRRKTRWEFILAIAAVAGITAAFAPAQPTGILVFDVIERVLLAVVVTLFAASSRRWTWLILAGTATVLAASIWGHLFGAVALAFAMYVAIRGKHRDRTTGALIGALSIQALLRTDDVGFFGLTALITGAVVLLVMISGYRTMRTRNKRRIRIGVSVIAVFTVLASAGFIITALRASPPVNSGVTFADQGLNAASTAQQAEAATSWTASHRFFAQANDILSTPFAKVAYAIPVLSQQAQTITTAAGSGAKITAAAAHAASVAPYQNLRAADGTFDLKTISSMEQPVAQTAHSMARARQQLNDTSTSWTVGVLRDRVDQFQGQLDEALPEADRALSALQAAPELLGGNGTRRYLLLFANPAEARGMGGFIGAWAELDATDGHLELVRHGKMGDLDAASDPASRHISDEPDFMRRYGHLQPARFIQNISASPDFPTVARVAEQLYPQAGGRKVDGVMYIDPIALGELLKLTGPVHAEGIPMPLTSKNAADFLMHDQYIDVATNDRSDLLSSAAEATFTALTHRTLPSIVNITNTLAPMVHQRRLLATVTDTQANDYLASIPMTGSFPQPRGGDLLSIRTSNGSANKTDYFLREFSVYHATYDPDSGTTTGDLGVQLTNGAPKSGQPAYILGNQDTRSGRADGRPFGSNTVQVSIHSALYPQKMTINHKTVGIQVQRELGSWVATQTVTIDAGTSATIGVHFSGKLPAHSAYRLTVIPQAMANPPVMGIAVSGDMGKKSKLVAKRSVSGAATGQIRVSLPTLLGKD